MPYKKRLTIPKLRLKQFKLRGLRGTRGLKGSRPLKIAKGSRPVKVPKGI